MKNNFPKAGQGMSESLDRSAREPGRASQRTATVNGLRRDPDSRAFSGSASHRCWIHSLLVKAAHGKRADPGPDTDERAAW